MSFHSLIVNIVIVVWNVCLLLLLFACINCVKNVLGKRERYYCLELMYCYAVC